MANVLDTNTLTRFLTFDDPRKALAVKRLLENSDEDLLVPDVLLAEIVWLLGSFYKQTRKDIVEKLNILLSIGVLQINREIILQTLNNFSKYNISWVDAYACALVQLGQAGGIYSYDRGIDKVPDVKRLEP